MIVDKLKEQHKTLVGMHRDIQEQLDRADTLLPMLNAEILAAMLESLRATLSLHLFVEDRMFYPQLEQVADPALQHLVADMQRDLGPIGAEFQEHLRRWCTAQAICNDFPTFRSENRLVMTRLYNRILREEHELYPAALPYLQDGGA